MLTYPPHLTIRRPSPTTIGFAVSNAQPTQSFAYRALSLLLIALRILLSSSILFLVLIKACCTVSTSSKASSGIGAITCPAILDATHQLVRQLALRYPWHIVGSVAVAILYLCCRRYHTEESLLVLQSLGIQTCTSSATYLSTATIRFIPTSEIQDIFIHEAFIGFEVRYYLAIVVKNEPELTVVFPKILPRRAILEEVWRGARACLFANSKHGPGLAKSLHHSRTASAKG